MAFKGLATRRGAAVGAAALASIIMLGGAVSTGRAEEAPDTARAAVESMLDGALGMLRAETADENAREDQLRLVLQRYFDLPTITRLVVGHHWRRATDAQKQAFAAAFEDHLVKVYASRLGAYGDEDVAIRKTVARTERDTIVSTEVRRLDNPPLAIDWLVRRAGPDYRVIDIAAEGVSMLTTKRSEFSAVIARDGIDGLIARLREINAAPPGSG